MKIFKLILSILWMIIAIICFWKEDLTNGFLAAILAELTRREDK